MRSRFAEEDGNFTSREVEAEVLMREQGGGSMERGWAEAGGPHRGQGQRLLKAVGGA